MTYGVTQIVAVIAAGKCILEWPSMCSQTNVPWHFVDGKEEYCRLRGDTECGKHCCERLLSCMALTQLKVPWRSVAGT